MSAWFRTFAPRPAAALRLICFPHAGGAASAYRGWAELLPPSIEVTAVQYPGRQDRIMVDPPADMDTLVREITAEIGPLLDRPVAFFGHSMGGTVGYEVARALPRELRPALVHFFPSARKAPHDCAPLAPEYRGDDGILRYVAGLGGNAGLLVAHEELRELALYVLRADFHLIDTYAHRPGAPLACPVTAVTGSYDAACTSADAAAWATYTTGAFDRRELPGGHFYLESAPEELLALLADALLPVTASAAR
ncbi:thioesterase II family protein [Streptomyces sp. NPDC093225]|uniref:thioesterase II family protein n=1 Tax=Streptomyces sp. NPDC093225 TaxID=3366034 RepID=UPI00381D2FCE